MPNIGVHLLLAGRVLHRWAERGPGAPFRADDPRAAAAFLHGAILPDAGYLPRSDRLFSELAHLFRTGDLARALVEEARTATERAHAWGWITHVLGDLAIHPLVNAAHGERLRGSREQVVTSTEDETGHMRMEYGLDAAVFAAHPEIDRIVVPAAAAGGDGLGHLGRAFRRTYGWEPGGGFLLRSSRRGVWAARMVRLINRVFTAPASRRPLHALLRLGARHAGPPRVWLPGSANRSPAALAILSPFAPPRWLVDEVSALAGRFGEWVDEHRDGALATLPNHDLVTGSAAAPTPRAEAARRALAERVEAAPATEPAPALNRA